jgi:hypothetical protein
VRATILGWSAASGLVLGLIAGTLLFAVLVVGGELLPIVPRLAGQARVAAAIVAFLILPLAGAALGWLEGRLKLR